MTLFAFLGAKKSANGLFTTLSRLMDIFDVAWIGVSGIVVSRNKQEQEGTLSELARNFSAVVHHLLRETSILPEFRMQFRPPERSSEVMARNLNAAFLIGLSGGRLAHPAKGYLSSIIPDENWGETARL